MDKCQILEHCSTSVDYTLFGGRWVPQSARLVLYGQRARGSGALQVYNMSQGKLSLGAEVEKQSAFKCGTFGASAYEERHLATGAFDGNLAVWDLERLSEPVYHARAHEGVINAIDGCGGLGQSGAPEIVTGGRDGSVKVWDTRQPNDPVADMSPDDPSTARDCWTVAFGNSYDEERCVVAGYDNGDIKLFDLRNMQLRWETTVPNGVCSLQFDRQDIPMNKLLVTGLESKFHVFDMRTLHEEEGFAFVTEKSHKATIWVGAHLPQDRDVFMTAGGNGSLNLWKYSYPKARKVKDDKGREKGVAGTLQLINSVALSTQPINSFDWNANMRGLCLTTAFDQTARVCIATNTNLL